MVKSDYRAVLEKAFDRAGKIYSQIEELQIEATKIRQFIMATINMLPDAERDAFLSMLEMLKEDDRTSEASLKDACLRVLRESYPRWLSATRVRDGLISSGFDFSRYTSNPLASVSTTLRRIKREEVQTADVEGVAAYRLRHRPRTGRLTADSDVYKSGMRGNEKPPE